MLDFTLPENHICLVSDDGSQTTSTLVKSLTERGWKLVVLSYPQSVIPQQAPLPEGIKRIELKELSEAHLQQQLVTITDNYGPIAAVVHLHPYFQGTKGEGIRFLEAEKDILKQVFFLAKHLKQSLNQAASQGHSCFVSIARLDGEFGFTGKVNYSPISAGLFGLTKTLNHEWKSVFCRAIDISPEVNSELSAQYIISELYDPNYHLAEVGYGSQGRTTLVS
ncbi:MAG: hypothetical protein F6J89_06300 [Symploca sp. SIO1C4]|uniref:Uncharacterized protein n=1 Tax=Symploca sp. SIO1C4 TaxID=2607765 RepID=A0A6B3NB36_9CYAN|nr:hypothetical protein [Symploca sp. SIO1C4]